MQCNANKVIWRRRLVICSSVSFLCARLRVCESGKLTTTKVLSLGGLLWFELIRLLNTISDKRVCGSWAENSRPQNSYLSVVFYGSNSLDFWISEVMSEYVDHGPGSSPSTHKEQAKEVRREMLIAPRQSCLVKLWAKHILSLDMKRAFTALDLKPKKLGLDRALEMRAWLEHEKGR